MGRNEASSFVYNKSKLGTHGEEWRKSFRNGDEGRGRGIPEIPTLKKIETGRTAQHKRDGDWTDGNWTKG
jgi:hypothetical protein